ncbi:hypothetical protein Salat_1744200 [Sesamum alatum]|uniref:Uncharacterized protein n=1 Tax=Sesamum alatum TaxID=300844 RepID=A0AAE1Y8W9_9LAMI|nr:hypothetical protein Salat_1744200 [Sesamum alatum]
MEYIESVVFSLIESVKNGEEAISALILWFRWQQDIDISVIPQPLPPFDLVDEKYVRHGPPSLSDTPDASPPPSNAPEVADTLDTAPDSPLPSYDADVGSYDASGDAADTLDVVPNGPAPSHHLDTGSYDTPTRVLRRSRRQKIPVNRYSPSAKPLRRRRRRG